MSSYEAEHLLSLKKRRRHLREKVLCAENCKMEKWSYLNGITLDKHCPTDCPVYQLSEKLGHKTSSEALKSYNSFFEVKDMNQNKKILKGLDYQIQEQEEIAEKSEKSNNKAPSDEPTTHKSTESGSKDEKDAETDLEVEENV